MDALNALYQQQHERQEELVAKAVATGGFAVCVFGKDTDDFLLVVVSDPQPITPDVTDAIKNRGLTFCGTLAIVNGEAHAASEPNTEAQAVMIAAICDFAKLHTNRCKAKPADWIERLFQLSDTRRLNKES